MGETAALLLLAVLSALVPLINIEAYLLGLAVVGAPDDVWGLSLVAAVGQMCGKLVWYYLGANALRLGWLQRKAKNPRTSAKIELWRRRTHERPWVGGLLIFASSWTGFPPFAVVAVVAGQLRLNLAMFVVLGTVGRTLRFAMLLGGAAWLTDLVGTLRL